MKTHLLLFTVAAAIFAGCAKDKGTDNTPIHITGGITAHSRAHTGMNTQFPSGRNVAFYVDNTTTAAQVYGNNMMTANGTGGFTGGISMYFPTTGDNVDIYAIHTNAALTATFPTAAVTHTVKADQKTAAEYYNSDLVYGSRINVAKTTAAIPLNFYHLLSKVRIAIAPGENNPDLTGATVKILGTKLSAAFTPSKTADMTSQTARAAMVAATGSAADITLGNEASADFTAANVKYNDAIAVPQEIAQGTTFIQVSLTTGEVMTYKLPALLTLQSGKMYTYEVTVNTPTGLTVTGTVTDWDDAGITLVDAN